MIHYSFFILLVILTSNPFSTAKEVISAYEADATITLTQAGKLNDFKSAIKNELHEEWMKTDLFLLKVLRSNNFDVHHSINNLRNIITWRKENRMEDILSEDFSDVEEFARYTDKLKDKFDQPVIYTDASATNMRRAIFQGKESRVRRYELYISEKFYRLVMEAGEKYGNVTRGVEIINLAGFSLVENLCLRCIAGIGQRVQIYETNYPESIDKSILVNAPSFVLPIVQTVKSFIRPENRNRVIVLGTNKKEHLEYFKTFMDENEIPTDLGGKKELEM